MTTFDVFLSHAWVDQLAQDRVAERPQRGLASELVRRLEAAGLSVFYDADDIHDGDQITSTASAALANASAFVVWYSSMYPTRQACRWELTTATRIDAAMDRIIAINPEADGAHLTGTPLKDTRIAACPEAADDAAWALVVNDIVGTVQAANGTTFGEIVEAPVDWFPERLRPAAHFTGRLRELWALHQLLTAHALTGQQQAVGSAVMVDGMAGSGKTVLALEYAQRYAPAWPGGVVWIKGHGYTKSSDAEIDQTAVQALLTQELVGVAASLGLDLGQLDACPTPDAKVTTLRALIANALDDRGPVLWIVDDVHPGLSADALQDWLAPGNLHEATSLVTSRSTEYEYGIARLTLDSLAPDEALWLLTRDQPPTDDAQRAAARQLVELLGGHPLAIDMTRAGINGPGGYTEWLQRMSAGAVVELEHLGRRVGSLAADHETSISAAMALSIQRLDADAQAMLRALACLVPLPIPIGLIAHDMGGDAEAIRVCEGVADQLERASLARIGSDSTVTLHRVVQLVAQQVLGVTDEQVAIVHESVANAIFATLVEMRGAAVAGPYRHCFELARTLRLDVDGDTNFSLGYWQGWYLYLSGQYAEASERLEHLLGVLIPAVGDADEAVLQVAFTWAAVLARLGRIDESTAIRETILEKRLAAGGPSDPLSLAAMLELSESYSESGRYPEAIELGEAALRSWAEIGSDLVAVAQVRGRLAPLYVRAGDPERAIPHAEAFLAWADSIGAAGHPDTLAVAGGLADAYSTVGRFDEAIAMMTAVAQSMAEVHGAQHPETLIAVGVLAGIYMLAGRADDSVATFQSIDAAMLEVFGPGHRETLIHRGNKAEALRMAGHVDVAVDEQEALIVQAEAVFGAEHAEVMTMHTQLGSMYLDAGRVEDAQREYERAYRGRQAAQGRDDPETLISAVNLAVALWTGGREREAVKLVKETVRLAEAAGGHPDLDSWRAFLHRAGAD